MCRGRAVPRLPGPDLKRSGADAFPQTHRAVPLTDAVPHRVLSEKISQAPQDAGRIPCDLP
ncbi:hypothetical protein BJ982_002936 [Sphaerisporangium siamense]|uniref:Uncharacterized protein n=1 Tax=Sphaerisporangium siamense TaxID=795645 RepID=A0A7W7G9I5_9ACTN|nr:hypothetical protein [Sphaerisporangium siamense]